ncbi:MAG: PQQ-binding-like beta-propeller repeat protein [Actinomycetota bacterium]|nr:PQQ-binding-like beta-propeller repeat protein [Actinomycetota bacterium]
MAADERAEPLDPRLVERFATLDAVPVPDVWDRVRAGDRSPVDGPRVGARRRRHAVLAAAAAVLVVAVASVAVVRAIVGSPVDDDVTVSADGPRTPSPGEGNGDGSPGGPAPADGCDLDATVARLRDGMPDIDHGPTTSPADLAAAVDVVVRGEVLSITPDVDGAVAEVRVFDAAGIDVERLGSPVRIRLAGPGPIDGAPSGESVIVFADQAADGEPMRVAPEGFWVGCGQDGPAASVIAEPSGEGWRELAGGGVSLDELWTAILVPDGVVGQVIGLPLVVGDGTAVFDVRLVTGERFRLSVPHELGTGLRTLTQRPAPAPFVVDGPAGTVTVRFERCADQDGMTENRLGSAVVEDGGTVRFCRPDELLSVAVESSLDLDASLDAFDLRPIELGSRYGEVLASRWPELAGCGNCAPWGPMRFEDAGVVVNRTGNTRITAVSDTSLDVVWTVETGGAATFLHGGPDGVYVEVTNGPFHRIRPASGAIEWSLERDEAERDAGFTPLGDGAWLLRSSFGVEGDDRAPLLRAIDPATGEVHWTAEGRQGTEWQWADPVTIGDLVVLMDVTNSPLVGVDPTGGSLRAYDRRNGEPVWTTDLDSPTEAFDAGLLHVLDVDDGRALVARTVDGDLVRVDDADGSVRWRTHVGDGRVTGTQHDDRGRLAIHVVSAGTERLVAHRISRRRPSGTRARGWCRRGGLEAGALGVDHALIGEDPERAVDDGVVDQVGYLLGRAARGDRVPHELGHHLPGRVGRRVVGQRGRRGPLGEVALAVEDRRAHEARAQARHADGRAGRLQLAEQALAHPDHGPLRRAVGAETGHDPGHRRRVHDVALVLLLEQRQERAHPVDHTPQVDVDHPLPGLERVPEPADTGVVAHHVHGAEPADGLVAQPLDRGGVAHVGRHGQRLDARRLDGLRRRLEVGHLHVGEHDVHPGPGEALGERPAHPRARPRHDGGLPHELVHLLLPPVLRSDAVIRCCSSDAGANVTATPCGARNGSGPRRFARRQDDNPPAAATLRLLLPRPSHFPI